MGAINVNERARAWVLVQASEPQVVAEEILNLDEEKDELVVVRADRVDGGPANLVAMIDAALEYYEQVEADIRAIGGIANVWFLRVEEHIPDPPHNASGYITEDEIERGERKENIYPGRQDSSPGFNPWG